MSEGQYNFDTLLNMITEHDFVQKHIVDGEQLDCPFCKKIMAYGTKLFEQNKKEEEQRQLQQLIAMNNSVEEIAGIIGYSIKYTKGLLNRYQLKAREDRQSVSSVILQYRKDQLIGQYASLKEAESKTGVAAGDITKVLRGEQKTTRSFYWERRDYQ